MFVFATKGVQCSSYLNLKFQASSLFLLLYSPACVRLGWSPKLLVFSCGGSISSIICVIHNIPASIGISIRESKPEYQWSCKRSPEICYICQYTCLNIMVFSPSAGADEALRPFVFRIINILSICQFLFY